MPRQSGHICSVPSGRIPGKGWLLWRASPAWPIKVFSHISRLRRMSPRRSIVFPFYLPAFENALHVAPLAVVVLHGYLKRFREPRCRVLFFCFLEPLGYEGREHPDGLFLEG